MQFASSTAAVTLMKSGQVRLIGAVAPKRSALFPDLPTMREQGIANIDIESWIGFVGPAGMEPQTVARLSDAVNQVLKTQKVSDDFRAGGVEPKWAGPEEFAGAVRQSYDLWARTLAAIGFRKE